MQALARLCVKRPVFASVLILSLVVVGIVGYSRLGVDRYPKVDFPTVAVITRLDGAAPEEVETEITDKIEESVNTIAGIDELQSTSAEGISQVFVTFKLEKNVDTAAQEVRDKVNRVLADLPKGVDAPIVEKLDPDATPILAIALVSKRPIREATEFADKVLRRQIESTNGVGQVSILGGRSRRINVRLGPTRLKAYGLTAVDVQRALERENVQVPGGALKSGAAEATVRVHGRVARPGEFESIVIREKGGMPVRIGDVATVEDGEEEAETVAEKDGTATLVLNVRKQSGSNTVEVIDAVKERLTDIRQQLPQGYTVEIVRDQSQIIVAALDTVKEHLLLGAFFATLVVLLFLGNWRSTLIAAIAIPTSIVSTYALMYAMGFSLNVLTLLALTLAVGIVIDDAIVVLENIFRFIEEKGRPPFEAAIEATQEIGLAVLATTLSLVAVFLPVAFMGGIVGRFMNSFGLTMAFAILVSLLVSFTLTPMLSARMLQRYTPKGGEAGHAAASRDKGFYRFVDRGYLYLLKKAMAHRWAVVVLAVLVLLSTVPLFKAVPKTFLPFDDESQFEVTLRAPEGTTLEATNLLARRIASGVKQLPGVRYTLLTIGDDDKRTPNAATIYVKLVGVHARKESQTAVMDRVRKEVLSKYADLNLRPAVQYVNAFSGGQKAAEIQYVINGPDFAELNRISSKLQGTLRGIPGMVDVDSSFIYGKPELGVTVDRAKASDLGVGVADVAGTLRILVGGQKVTAYEEGGEQYDVYLRARPEDRAEAMALKRFSVPSSTLGSVGLEDVTTFRPATGPSEINRLNRQRQVTIYANLIPGYSSQKAIDQLVAETKAMKLPATYKTRFIGRSKEQGRAAQNFLLAFGLSLVFMYLILAAQFESWLHPVTILLSLPLTVPFALLSILIFGQSMNIFTMLGILVLFGVVKKNSILQVEFANQLRARGVPRDEAVVEASRERLRPILMTTLAFVAGMLPLIFSSGDGAGTNRAIGSVIAGGQTLALLLTLIATPVAYSLFDDASRIPARLRARFSRRRIAEDERAEAAA
jgi:HAE1 family hydrophobic/amphiphilic exporter-1